MHTDAGSKHVSLDQQQDSTERSTDDLSQAESSNSGFQLEEDIERVSNLPSVGARDGDEGSQGGYIICW